MRTTSIGCSSGSFSIRLKSRSTGVCPFFFSSRRRHTRCSRDWSSDVCSSDLGLAYFGLADVYYYSLKQYADAAKSYKEGLRFRPDNVTALYNLGWCYNDLERYPEARSEERRVGKACRWQWSRAH